MEVTNDRREKETNDGKMPSEERGMGHSHGRSVLGYLSAY